MTTTGRLRAYARAVQGWGSGKLNEADIDLLVKTRWITKEQGEEIKAMRRGDPELLQRFAEVTE